MDEARKNVLIGVAAVVLAAATWGISPLYYRLLAHIPPLDVLAHRTIWSFAVFLVVLGFQRRVRELISVYTDRGKTAWIGFAALMISVNWFIFILSVQIGRVTESSLGYYMFPLFSVAIGALVFRERLTFVQWVAVGLATVAVTTLTVGLGVLPWISLSLAVTFAIYGAIKKHVSMGPVLSVTAEVGLFLPPALLWLALWAEVAIPAPRDLALLILSGPLTAIPLILFSTATKRIRMSSVGLLAYINPTLQFLVAALIFLEPVTIWHAIAFPLIWLGLALYSGSAVAQDRAARKADTAAGTSSTT